ncbi:ATP-binding protein [candidate division KSB1 bacterium]|nr:ATP-binding protein [candidate division KSB1 bacterium]
MITLIPRKLTPIIQKRLFTGKAMIIIGARQTGKTTIIQNLAQDLGESKIYLNADEPIVRDQLENAGLERLKMIIGKKNVFILDEAQRIKNIGLTLKLIIDELKNVQVIASGSSSFQLTDEINEPLTGRKWEYQLFPISWQELVEHAGMLQSRMQLEQRLIFGMYPDIFNYPGDERLVLSNLAASFLYKDLLSFQGIRKPDLLDKLLRAVALQLGNEVSYNELATMLGVDKNTVMSYIDLLEKVFIIFRLQSLSRNLRNEIMSSRKIYFYDNGIRNAIIGNFNLLHLRQDTGALWENFLVSERLKYFHYSGFWGNRYFWRTRQQQEIDYVEERDGKFHAFEFKWNPQVKVTFPKVFRETYPECQFEVITPHNFEQFLGI